MQKIQLLDSKTINKIAAGEVVESPKSVVKELAENAIDAGASAVTVEIRDGGISYIRVTDNGCGIPKEQVKSAFLRHATSKLSRIEDLEHIFTLGFRGEALASIAAVAQVELLTKTKEEETGTRICISAGEIEVLEDAACKEGTSITVQNLFYNVPARRKFLKKPATESGHVSDLVNKLALGHPEVSMQYINNGTTILHTAGNNDAKTAVFYVYGKEAAKQLLPISYKKGEYAVSGLIGRPELCRANRNYENLFINGRFIKNSVVSSAVEEAYKTKLTIGKFPLFVLYLEVEPAQVDVNVHPAKLEVRFKNDDEVYDFFYTAVSEALQKEVLIPQAAIEKKPREKQPEAEQQTIFAPKVQKTEEKPVFEEKKPVQSDDFICEIAQEDTEEVGRAKQNERKATAVQPMQSAKPLFSAGTVGGRSIDELLKRKPSENRVMQQAEMYQQEAQTAIQMMQTEPIKEDISEGTSAAGIAEAAKEAAEKDTSEKESLKKEALEKEAALKQAEKQEEAEKQPFFHDYTIVGQVFRTYWMVEQENALYLIDQHAAHERVLYEELMNRFKAERVVSQRMLEPMMLNLTPMEMETLKENRELLESFGFELEAFADTFALKSTPYFLKNQTGIGFFTEILDRLAEERIRSVYDMKLLEVATMACKAAVKGNDVLSVKEAEALIHQLLKLEHPFTCPHGRPTIVALTQYELEKLFKRVQN